MLMINNAIFQARRTDSLATAIRAISEDDALKSLQPRQDFKDLIK
jgi:hypothetical protein